MAGDWLKFETATPDKPEVWEIAEKLNLDPDAVVGKLLRIWSWFDQQTEEGNAPSVTKKLLDRSVGVTGFCDAMVSCEWMIETDGEIILPNFGRHNGKTAKNRALTAKRVAAHKEKTNASGNEKVTQAPLPKEEKRREDNNKGTNALDFSGWPQKPSDGVWSEYKKLRDKKRAPITQGVIDRLTKPINELTANDWTVDQVLQEMVFRGWQGLEASWLLKDQPKKPDLGGF